MQRLLEWLVDRLCVRSRDLPPPWGPLLRGLRFPAALLRDWFTGELNVRAMSLAYTTLLSIVPLIAFSFSILKALGAHTNLAALLFEFFRPMGGAAGQLTASVMQFVKNLRGDVLSSIGLVFLVYTVVTTIQKVESSFNYVWRVGRSRSLARRIGEYLSAMIVGPVLMAAAFGVLASAHNSPFARWIDAVLPLQWTFSILGKIVPYAVVTATFTVMYALIPNTRVKRSAALTGGIAAGALWALSGKMFTAFITYSSQLIAIYTGFAVVLTTLIWIYVSWLILLLGAQLAFYVQYPQYLRHGQEIAELIGGARERAALTIMILIGRDYARGDRRWTGSLLAAELDVPGAALDPVLGSLERAGLIAATESGEFLPGRDTRGILAVDVLDAARRQPLGRMSAEPRTAAPAEELVREAEAAMHDCLAGRTLNDLIAAGTAAHAGSLAGDRHLLEQ